MPLLRVASLAAFASLSSLLYGCAGGAIAPTLLVQQNVSGTYPVTGNGGALNGTTLLSARLASGDPIAERGTDYYSPLTGTIVTVASFDLGACNGVPITVTGRVTNPNVNQVLVAMTGTTAGNGTLTLNGTVGNVGNGGDLGSLITGTLNISGGSCPMADTPVTLVRQ